MVRIALGTANTKLEKVLGVAHRHRGKVDVLAEAEKCADTAARLLKTIKE